MTAARQPMVVAAAIAVAIWATSLASGETIHVSFMHRHGARGPFFDQLAFAQLSPSGIAQGRCLGKAMAAKYAESTSWFAAESAAAARGSPPPFDQLRSFLVSNSSDIGRTVQTAIAVTDGLLLNASAWRPRPPGTLPPNGVWPGLSPFVRHTPLDTDDTLALGNARTNFYPWHEAEGPLNTMLLQAGAASPLVRYNLTTSFLSELVQQLPDYGWLVCAQQPMDCIYLLEDTAQCFAANGAPDWASTALVADLARHYPAFRSITSLLYQALYGFNASAAPALGALPWPLLNAVVAAASDAIAQHTSAPLTGVSPRFVQLSTHDTVMAAVLSAMRAVNAAPANDTAWVPAFALTLGVELDSAGTVSFWLAQPPESLEAIDAPSCSSQIAFVPVQLTCRSPVQRNYLATSCSLTDFAAYIASMGPTGGNEAAHMCDGAPQLEACDPTPGSMCRAFRSACPTETCRNHSVMDAAGAFGQSYACAAIAVPVSFSQVAALPLILALPSLALGLFVGAIARLRSGPREDDATAAPATVSVRDPLIS